MDLVSASSEKLERLPESSSREVCFNQEDQAWLEAVSEKAERGESWSAGGKREKRRGWIGLIFAIILRALWSSFVARI